MAAPAWLRIRDRPDHRRAFALTFRRYLDFRMLPPDNTGAVFLQFTECCETDVAASTFLTFSYIKYIIRNCIP